MRRLLLFVTLLVATNGWVLAQTETPTPTATPSIFTDRIVEFENLANGSHPYIDASGDCLSNETYQSGISTYSNGYMVYYTGAGFDCYFGFYGSGFGVRYWGYSAARNISVVIDGYEVFQLLNNDNYTYKYVDLELGQHSVDFVDMGTGNYVWLDYALFRTHLEAFSPEITPEVTQAVELQLTPDGATYYATVVFDEVSQTVALRYQVDAGQVMIAILLMAMVALLLVMLIVQMRRGAPEP